MHHHTHRARTTVARRAACAFGALLASLPAVAAAQTPVALSDVPLGPIKPPRASQLPGPPPPTESDRLGAGASASPFARVAATTGQTLVAPVVVNANTADDGLTVTQRGGGRAVTGSVTSGSNALSAVKGITAGSGSGVNGVNTGTAGPAGKFEITNGSSTQPGVLATTAGNGTAVQAVVNGTGASDAPAVLGQHNGKPGSGIGVEGDGGSIGVKGRSTSTSGGYGVYGYAADPAGSSSSYAYGVYGESPGSVAVAGQTDGGVGVWGTSTNFLGVYGHGANYAGVKGYSERSYGVWGISDTGTGVVGQSGSGYAGMFYGPVYASGAITAASYGYTSDRALKQDFASVEGGDVLERIAAMPITAWDYKDRPAERHIGPMAQDFRAAFGLGADDRHIDVVDGIGVSLAAIQELQRQLKDKNARLADQQARIDAITSEMHDLHRAVDARLAALERDTAMASARPVSSAP